MATPPSSGVTPRFDSVWLRPATRDRHSTTLSREQIVAKATELLDKKGVSGLTMRALAKDIGSSPMALYYHVANKEDLLELAIDEVFGEAGIPAEDLDWREALRSAAHSLFDAFLRHPWVAGVLGSCPPLGPNAMAGTQAIVGAFARGGLTDDELDMAVGSYYYYVIGAAITEASWASAGNIKENASAVNVMTTLYGTKEPLTDPVTRYIARNASLDARERFELGLRGLLGTRQ